MCVLVAARTPAGLIGVNNTLPWSRIPEDMAHFKRITEGGVTIMGRVTYESIPEKFRPLPGRKTIVVTSNNLYDPGSDEVDLIHDLNESILTDIRNEYPGKPIYVVGGGEIYKKALREKLIGKAIITMVGVPTPYDPSNVYLTDSDLTAAGLILDSAEPLVTKTIACSIQTYVLAPVSLN